MPFCRPPARHFLACGGPFWDMLNTIVSVCGTVIFERLLLSLEKFRWIVLEEKNVLHCTEQNNIQIYSDSPLIRSGVQSIWKGHRKSVAEGWCLGRGRPLPPQKIFVFLTIFLHQSGEFYGFPVIFVSKNSPFDVINAKTFFSKMALAIGRLRAA